MLACEGRLLHFLFVYLYCFHSCVSEQKLLFNTLCFTLIDRLKRRGHSYNVFSLCLAVVSTHFCFAETLPMLKAVSWPDLTVNMLLLIYQTALLKILPTLKVSLFLSHTHRNKGTQAVTLSLKAVPFQTVLLCTLEILIFTPLWY